MGTREHTARLFDMHCHLGFVEDAEAVRSGLLESDAHALSCTVTPAEYEQDLAAFEDIATCTVALGLHPWWVGDADQLQQDLQRFKELAPTTRFVGEVGLDYANERDVPAAKELQRTTFAMVLKACDAPSPFPRKLISIHDVRATDDALDKLEEYDTCERHDCIFHGFSGSFEDLKRAIDLGCFFSVGPRMLHKKRGVEYVRTIPEDKLLLESDLPTRRGAPWSAAAWIDDLRATLSELAKIHNVPAEELAGRLARTSEALIRPA